MTTQASGTPHAAALQEANPGLDIRVRISPQETGKNLWRNCDRNLREWWRQNRETVTQESVLFLEFDVFCNVALGPRIPPLAKGCGIAAAAIVTPVARRCSYWPFEDLLRLPRPMLGLACATAPLAVLQVSRKALDAILSPEYDALFAADIFCELRLPTAIRHAGFGVAEIRLPDVGCIPVTPTHPGIWHPVKLPFSFRS